MTDLQSPPKPSAKSRLALGGTAILMVIAVDWFAIFNVADIFAVVGIVAWAALHLTGRGATTGAR